MAALVALVSALAVAPALAQPPPAPSISDEARAQAAEKKKAADQAMDALRYADALAGYGDAYAISRDPALLYNMGRALQALNRYPEALERLEAFDAAAPPELEARVPRLAGLIAELRARVATLSIRTNVPGARILVRDTVVGKSPLPEPLKVEAGAASIEIDAEGYFPARKTVELRGGAAQTVDLELFSKATSGVLAVRASKSGAEVLVDGQRIGVAPLEQTVAKGAHRVTVRHPGSRLFETSVVVPAGGSKSLMVELQAPSVVTRWWFWTAAGAVVATGVAITAAALTERSPDTGTIAPGQLPTAGARGAWVHF